MLVCYIVITALSAEFTKHGKSSVGYAEVAFLFFFFGEYWDLHRQSVRRRLQREEQELIVLMALAASYDFGWTGLQSAYPIEVLPFSLRAKGYSITQFCIYLAL